MKRPSLPHRIYYLLMMVLMIMGLAVNAFTYYAKVRVTLAVWLNECIVIALLAIVISVLFRRLTFEDVSLTKRLRISLLLFVLIYVIGFASVAFTQPEYLTPRYAGGYVLRAHSWSGVLVANLIGATSLVALAFGLRIVRSFILHRQKKHTETYFNLMLVSGALTMLSAALTGRPLKYDPSYNNAITSVLLATTTFLMFVNMFRVTWLTVLNRRQKFMTFLGGCLFTMVSAGLYGAEIGGGVTLSDIVNSYSLVAGSFLFLIMIFAFLYSLITTIGAFFHLPTAAIYDKKVKEINSIYTLSRTINSLFDFDKIVSSVTGLVCEATNSQACWLEMANHRNPTSRQSFNFVALKTRENFHVHFLEVSSKKYLSSMSLGQQVPSNDMDFRNYLIAPTEWMLENKKPLVINQVRRDKSTRDIRKTPIESMIGVPLISYDEVIGIIFAVKPVPFGFDQDDVAVVSAFANQTTVAIENARLVKSSLEKERLEQELRIAHEVQMKLIPQVVPVIRNESQTVALEIGARTIPANEVGGDYYDFIKLAGWRTGVVVADVSGKGTSAAFYMAEIKGIVQALAGIYSSPKDLMVAVNDVLYGTLDRKSFITLIYVDVDISTGLLRFARAGHCPLLHIRGSDKRFYQPKGLGLGLDSGAVFRSTIEEHTLTIERDDLVILYSDGLIEARNERGEEFGEDRLCKAIEAARSSGAEDIKERIVREVRTFVGSAPVHDDLTCVVLKMKEINAAAPAEARPPTAGEIKGAARPR